MPPIFTREPRPPGRGMRAHIGLLLLVGLVPLCAVIWLLYPRGPYPDWRYLRHKGTLESVTVESAATEGGVVMEDVLLSGSTGLEVRARIRRPAGEGVRYPAGLLMGGLRTGRDVVGHVPPEAPPMVWASIDYQDAEPPRGSFLAVMRALPGLTRKAEESVAGMLLLLDHLELRSDVDTTRTLAAGGSLGAYFAAVAAALDGRFEAVALFHAGSPITDGVATGLAGRGGWQERLGPILARPWLDPVDPVHYVGRIAPRPLLVVGSREDERIPASGIETLYTAAGEPRDLVWMESSHVIQDDPAEVAILTETVIGWLNRKGWDLLRTGDPGP